MDHSSPSGPVHSHESAVHIHPVVQALTAARKSRGMTQSELANQAGLSRMTVQRLESNGLDPRLSTLHEMAQVLDHRLVTIPAHLQAAFAAWLQQQPGAPA